MSQSLEFSATAGLTLTAIACPVGSYTGTAATSVTQQAGTDRYLAAFAVNLAAGAYRLDYLLSGSPFGSEVYDVSGSGTFQPRSESAGLDAAGVRSAVGLASANLDTQLGNISSAVAAKTSVTVVPLTGVVEDRVAGTRLTVFINETTSFSVPCVDAQGAAVSLAGLTLEINIETLARVNVATILDAAITKNGSTFTFAVPTAVSASVRKLQWSLRKTSDKGVLMYGEMPVVYAARIP